MKRALIIVGLLLLVLAAGNGISAQSDPFNGTWKLNPSKSKYTTGAPPKEMTFTISTVGDLTQVEGTGKAKDDSPVQFKYATPLKGGTGKFITDVPPDYDGVSRKIINDNTHDVSYLKKGKVVTNFTAVVSKDGKTMTLTSKGTDAQGKSASNVAVYEKQ